MAHHPPGWVTVLGLLSWLGARSLLAHQMAGLAIGLGVVVLAGLVGRRYFDERVGALAALFAALYPGFWLMEARVLSEPLGLLLLGVFTLAVAALRERPSAPRCAAPGVLCGVLALVRSEQLALLAVVVAPVLLLAPDAGFMQRGARLAVVIATCAATIAPWTIYNSTRFAQPVLLSTNGGGTLLAGNCPPATYLGGDRLGYFDSRCEFDITHQNLDLDRSQVDELSRRAALRNIGGHLAGLPLVVLARYGRTLALYRPSQTVSLTAFWMSTPTWPIWAWVASYWVLFALAIAGGLHAWRSGRFLLPLLAPLAVAGAAVTIAFGEPRYHAIADLGVVVLAAAGLLRLLAP